MKMTNLVWNVAHSLTAYSLNDLPKSLASLPIVERKQEGAVVMAVSASPDRVDCGHQRGIRVWHNGQMTKKWHKATSIWAPESAQIMRGLVDMVIEEPTDSSAEIGPVLKSENAKLKQRRD